MLKSGCLNVKTLLITLYISDTSGGGTGAGAPLYQICTVARFSQTRRRGADGPVCESATRSKTLRYLVRVGRCVAISATFGP